MENTKANDKYYRQNGAVVEGKDIPAVRTQQLKDTIRNGRLGTYNAHGRYMLSPRVTNEIFGITKYVYKEHFDEVIKESKDVLEFKASASIPVFGQMEFRLVFKNNFAKLYLIENVYREFNGYLEIYGEQITEVNCEDDKNSVVDYVFSLLNVKIIDESDFGKIPDEDPEKVKAILFDKLYLAMIAKNYLKDSSEDERDTFEDMVNSLKGGGEYGKRVLKHFVDRIEKRPDIMQLKDEDGYNEALNDALIGALEVATTEDDLKDPYIKKIYEDLYKRRFKNTEEDLNKAKEKVNEKDFKKVADGVLGKNTSDKLFDDPEEIASLIGEKEEEIKQGSQDNKVAESIEQNPILKKVLYKEKTQTSRQDKKSPEESKEQDAQTTATEQNPTMTTGQTLDKVNDEQGKTSKTKGQDGSVVRNDKRNEKVAAAKTTSSKSGITKKGGNTVGRLSQSAETITPFLPNTAGAVPIDQVQISANNNPTRRRTVRLEKRPTAEEMGLGVAQKNEKVTSGQVQGIDSATGQVTILQRTQTVVEKNNLGQVASSTESLAVESMENNKRPVSIKKNKSEEVYSEELDDRDEVKTRDDNVFQGMKNLGFLDLISEVGVYRGKGNSIKEAIAKAEAKLNIDNPELMQNIDEIQNLIKNQPEQTTIVEINKQETSTVVSQEIEQLK